MAGKHLKRVAAPRAWKIPRKTSVFIVKPNPGAHPLERGLALSIVIKDYLKLADTTTEARMIIGKRMVQVDGRFVHNYKFCVGLMDVITLPKTHKNYRVLIDQRGQLRLKDITAEEAKWKLTRVENKRTIRGKKFQLNLHDGRNIVTDQSVHKTGDVLKIELPTQKILETYQFKQGNVAYMIGGRHVGQVSSVVKFESAKNPEPVVVTLSDGYNTIKDNLFIIGNKSPELSLLEGVIA